MKSAVVLFQNPLPDTFDHVQCLPVPLTYVNRIAVNSANL